MIFILLMRVLVYLVEDFRDWEVNLEKSEVLQRKEAKDYVQIEKDAAVLTSELVVIGMDYMVNRAHYFLESVAFEKGVSNVHC